MPTESANDVTTLRFVGDDGDGVGLHELRAAHVAEVLQGLVGLNSDFAKAGVFHVEGPAASEVLVRPAQEGSFLIEVVRVVVENWDAVKATASTTYAAAGAVGVPSLGTILWWATKSARADVKDFDYLENGNVKVIWQDDKAEEIPLAAWKELNTRRRRRRKQLRQIMAPLSDSRVTKVDVTPAGDDAAKSDVDDEVPSSFTLSRTDYDAVRPSDEVEERSEVFEVEARMSAIDFDDPSRWRVKTKDRTRNVTVDDQEFLRRVKSGLAIRPSDIFWLRIREDATVKNGRTGTKWFVEHVERHRRAAGDDEPQDSGASPT